MNLNKFFTWKNRFNHRSSRFAGIEHAAALLENEAKVVLTDIKETGLALTADKLTGDFPP